MQVYPAYTIENIETELSWREVGLLIKNWEAGESSYQKVTGIEKLLKAKFGIKKVSIKPLSGDDLINRLIEEGSL